MSRSPKRIAIGFTGTRRGMTERQKLELARFLRKYGGQFHHGLCVGADAEAHHAAKKLGYWTVGHPSTWTNMRSHCVPDEIREPKPPLVRNHDIVDEVFAMVACPGTKLEELRSGTWTTIRYARAVNRPITIILP